MRLTTNGGLTKWEMIIGTTNISSRILKELKNFMVIEKDIFIYGLILHSTVTQAISFINYENILFHKIYIFYQFVI